MINEHIAPVIIRDSNAIPSGKGIRNIVLMFSCGLLTNSLYLCLLWFMDIIHLLFVAVRPDPSVWNPSGVPFLLEIKK